MKEDAEKLRWGVLGTGGIAHKFGQQLGESRRGELVAVGSRTGDQADAFSSRFGGSAHGSYEALLDDHHVDAVYISLPNALHHPWTLKALAAGKHVLCEKPIATSEIQAQEMFAAAEKAERTLIEGFMYRCQPIVRKLLQLAREGAIGEPRLIRSNFTFQRDADPADVRYQAELGGGSLMDVGCYCINLARALTDAEPNAMRILAHLHETGVEDYAAGLLAFDEGALASFTCGMTVQADRHTYVGGSEGLIAIDAPWFSGGSLTVVRKGQAETIREESDRPLYALEADEFAACVQDDQPPFVTATDSLGNMRVLDQLRQQMAEEPS